MNRNTSKLVRGYDIRVQREGSDDMREKQHAWGVEQALPEEWDQVKADPTVVRAEIFLSSQRRLRPSKRRLSDEYSRS